MRVLILSCSTGGGHNSCAKAIAKSFELRGHSCDIVDSLSFVSKSFKKMMSEGHSLMYRKFPKVFSVGYGFAERHPHSLEKGSPAYKMLSIGSERLFEFIKSNGYDTVISVHVFPGLMLNEIFSNNEPPLFKTAFVATDCTCSPGVTSFGYDYYFIPTEDSEADFIKCKIPDEKIFPVGIPVGETFFHSIPKHEAKAAFGISASDRHLVMMCGSMGCGPIEKITENLSLNIPENTEVSVVCGSNRKLYKKLSENHRNNKNIHIFGFVKDVSLLLDSADLYLTKPGGLSTAEALAKGLPMVFFDAVSGCEKYNMNYFVSIGGAETALCDEIHEKCFSILADCEKLGVLSQNLIKHQKKDSAEKICRILEGNANYSAKKETVGAFNF